MTERRLLFFQRAGSMIDLTPLDVRKKKGDFKKGLRGYDSEEVDVFMDLVAERLEELVKENLLLRDRVEKLQVQVDGQEGREKAVHEALVTAQELREQMKAQAKKEGELIRREAEAGAREILADAERRMEWLKTSFQELERKRLRFLRSFRTLLERELDGVAVEEEREPLSELAIDLDLGGSLADHEGADMRDEPAPGEEPPGLDDREASREAAGGGEGEGNGRSVVAQVPEAGSDRSEGPGTGDDELLLSFDDPERRSGEAL